MRVTQSISIGSLRINSMSNTSILQIGTCGSMKSRSENINEYIPQAQANQKLEGKIGKELKKEMHKEGLPVEPWHVNGIGTGTQQGSAGGTGAGTGTFDPTAPGPGEGPDVIVE